LNLAPPAIATAVEMLINHQHLTIQDGDVVTAALEHYRRLPRLDFSDCLVVEIARKVGHLPVATFDRRLAKLDGVQKIQR
jgi:predicted nucleic-acid-binding protein